MRRGGATLRPSEADTVTAVRPTSLIADLQSGCAPLWLYASKVEEAGRGLGECAWTVLGAEHVRAA